MKVLFNPYPGLRSFETEEDYLFFGREDQTDELIRQLRTTRFLAVVGTSGSGKSSLVKAGLLPGLQGGFMAGTGSAWRIALFRPGGDPIGNLARALNAPEIRGETDEDEAEADIRGAIMETILRRSSCGLTEAVIQANFQAHENLLVVVDQFEEVFRYKETAVRENGADDSAAFVKMLLEAAGSDAAPVYIAITMRSEYIGECSQFRDLPEAVNAGQYLIPRMTREQIRRAIERPAAVSGVEMCPRLVHRLLNDVGDDPDQLPILQHALMRTWDNWLISDEDCPDLHHYRAIGGMEDALSKHADEIYDNLPNDDSRRTAEKLFKAVTESGREGRDVRRPVRLGALFAITAAAEEDVIEVIDAFRPPGCAFICPGAGIALDKGQMVDISHESLMRVWRRLRIWVAEEARSAGMYRRLAETAVLYNHGRAGLWRDPDLSIALDWYEKNDPNPAWAARYNPEFDAAIAFLDESRKARDEAEKRKEEARQRELEEAKTMQNLHQRVIFAISLGFMFAVFLAILALSQFQTAQKANERAEVEKKISRSGELASLSIIELGNDPTRSFRLAEAALAAKPSLLSQKTVLPPLNHPLHRLYNGHAGKVSGAVFSSDGTRIVTASHDKTARVLDSRTGKEICALRGHLAQISRAVFSPDGHQAVTGSYDHTARIWDAAAGREIHILKGHLGEVVDVSFSPDGKRILTASYDNMAIVWDRASGERIRVLKGHTGAVLSAVFSPAGRMAITASDDKTARIWDIETGRPVHVLTRHMSSVFSAIFSPNGRLAATVAGDNAVRIWSVRTGQEKHVLKQYGVIGAEFSPDGTCLATASYDKTARIWDLETGAWFALEGHTGEVVKASYSPDGNSVITASYDGTARVWNAESGAPISVLRGHESDVNDAAFSPDGKSAVTASDDKTVRIWELATGKSLRVLKGHAADLNSAMFSPDGTRLLTASDDSTAGVWDTKTGTRVHALEGHEGYVLNAVFAPMGNLAITVSYDGTARIWDVAGGQLRHILVGHGGFPTDADFSPDGALAATGLDDGTTRIWDAQTGMQIKILEGHVADIASVAFSPDGSRILTASNDHTARIWNVRTGREIYVLEGHTDEVAMAIFSPDGSQVATASYDNTARIWDAVYGTAILSLEGHESDVNAIAFSPDGTIAATASDDATARTWNLHSEIPLNILRGHKAEVVSVAFSPDGSRIVTASFDKTARVWDTESGREIHVLDGHGGGVACAVFSKTGNRIATASTDDTARIWPGNWRAALRAINEDKIRGIVRGFTREELSEYGFDRTEAK